MFHFFKLIYCWLSLIIFHPYTSTQHSRTISKSIFSKFVTGHQYLKTAYYEVLNYSNLSSIHGECPVWDGGTQTLYWVDVHNQNVHRLEYTTRKHKVKHIGYGQVNIVWPVANSCRLLLSVRSELYLLDWDGDGDTKSLRHIATFDQGKPDNVLNDGKADALGRFWTGTKGPQSKFDVEIDEAALYSLESPCFIPQIKVKPVTISNGMSWALNNSILYYIDSEIRKIDAFDFDLKRGHIRKRRTIIDLRDYGYSEALPDGMTIDQNGMLWVALMFSGTIIRIDPDARRIIERYKLPVSGVTSLTWAGKHLDQLVVTTSKWNVHHETLAREPLSGSLFVLQNLGTAGVPVNKFYFPDADHY